MPRFPALPPDMLPERMTMTLPGDMVDEAEHELRLAAEANGGCMAYFPTESADSSVDVGLSATRALVELDPYRITAGRVMEFCFAKLTTEPFPNRVPFHLDESAATGIKQGQGNPGFPEKVIWRIVANLGQEPRTIEYVDADPYDLLLKRVNGQLTSAMDVSDRVKQITLPSRKGDSIGAVAFCASRVLHGGRDRGNFIWVYGSEETEVLA